MKNKSIYFIIFSVLFLFTNAFAGGDFEPKTLCFRIAYEENASSSDYIVTSEDFVARYAGSQVWDIKVCAWGANIESGEYYIVKILVNGSVQRSYQITSNGETYINYSDTITGMGVGASISVQLQYVPTNNYVHNSWAYIQVDTAI